jgi:hypothetical protein
MKDEKRRINKEKEGNEFSKQLESVLLNGKKENFKCH